MKFVFILLVICICALAIQSLTTEDASNSGRNFSISNNNILVGELRDRGGRYHHSSIDLSGYIANDNGDLVFR